MPHISIIVPAYNSENAIERCLKAIRGSLYRDYEIIVVDDGSKDNTRSIAKNYADKVVSLRENSGRAHARSAGADIAQGAIIVNIDSDVLIRNDSLALISEYFSRHEDVDAVTGLLSKECPFTNFSSRYKILYMNYTFKKLPERVTFLSGAIYAIRSRVKDIADREHKYGVDTAFGQKLFSRGRKISFLRALEVVHLNKYDFFTLLKRNFLISFYWTKIFFKYRGWAQLGKNRTGYAHASKEQIASVAVAPMIIASCIAVPLDRFFITPMILCVALWCLLNFRFFIFLKKERGYLFAALSLFTLFLENIIMAFGIASGSLASMMSNLYKGRKEAQQTS